MAAQMDMDQTLLENPPDLNSNFSLCILCQKISPEKCIQPSLNKASKTLGNGHTTLARELKEFHKIGALKCPRLQKLLIENNENLETYFKIMEVKWHKTCKLSYSKTRLNREKSKASSDSENRQEEMSTDTMTAMVDWIQNERKGRKPFCHFLLSDI